MNVLRGLDKKWEQRKLVWTNHPETEPSTFKKLAREYTPSVLFLVQALYMRQLLYGESVSHRKNRELELYLADSWS